MRFGVCAAIFLFFAGCNHEKVAPATPATAPQVTVTSGAKAPPHELSSNQKMSNTLAMSGDIVRLCGLKPTASATAPKFDYDKDQLTDDDHNVLQQLATCMLRGALQGKNVELIGRADPRGTEEYNLALGSRLVSTWRLWASARPICRRRPAELSTPPAATKRVGPRIAAST